MKKNNHHHSKPEIVKALKEKGITIKRISVEGQRTRETSDGNWLSDLQEIIKHYGLFNPHKSGGQPA